MENMEMLINIIREAEKLLDNEFGEFGSPTNGDFEWALGVALKGSPLRNRVDGGFYYTDGDREAKFLIKLDGKPVFEAGSCHLAGYPGNRTLGNHSGYYYGVTAI